MLANRFDKSQLRNWLALDVAQKMNMPSAVEMHYVNLYLNGEYNGLYLMTQGIDVEEGNVEITDLVTPENNDGGYLLEFYNKLVNVGWTFGGFSILMYEPGFQTDHNSIVINAPKQPKAAEVNCIYQYMQEVEDRVFNKTDDSYREYLDFDSWVNMYYMTEVLANMDAQISSSYMYKDAGSQTLYCGPAWDYDISMGGVHSQNFGLTPNYAVLEVGEVMDEDKVVYTYY